jgi:hypothetical protein
MVSCGSEQCGCRVFFFNKRRVKQQQRRRRRRQNIIVIIVVYNIDIFLVMSQTKQPTIGIGATAPLLRSSWVDPPVVH